MLLLEPAARRNASPIDSYFREINDSSLLTPDIEHELAMRIQDGDNEAREAMIKSNLRLVVAIARRYVGRGLCLADLIQEGNLGLVHAAERFDPAANTRFSTYAKFWINAALVKTLQKSVGPVRTPMHANNLKMNWVKAGNEMRVELGRDATDEEIAARLQLTRRQIAIVRKAQRIHRDDPRSASDSEFLTPTHAMVDPKSPAPDAHMSADEETRQVVKLLDRLLPREGEILRLRFGLNGSEPMTLLDIGQRLNLTRERVRQLEKSAMSTMRELIEAEG